MLSNQTLNVLKHVIKSLSDSGVIGTEEYQESALALRNVNKPKEKKKLELLTKDDVAALFKCSKRQIDRLSDQGILKRIEMGKNFIRFNSDEVNRLMAGN